MGVKNNLKNGKNAKTSSNKLQQISESPCQSDSNCFFGIKSYIRDFYQKDESDQESGMQVKQTTKYSSTDSETDSDGESGNCRDLIKNCDKLKKKLKGKSRRKLRKFINYSRDQWNLFGNNDSDEENTNFKNKKLIDEEGQRYKANSNRWSVYAWRSIFTIGFALLICGLLLAFSFLLSEHQVEMGKQEEMEIIDRNAIEYNKSLKQARALSLALISVGLLLFLSTLLLPALIGVSLNCFSGDKKRKDQTLESFFNGNQSDSDNETSAKMYLKCDKNARKQKRKNKIDQPIEDNISKIPTFEQIQTVQPEREKEETFLRKN